MNEIVYSFLVVRLLDAPTGAARLRLVSGPGNDRIPLLKLAEPTSRLLPLMVEPARPDWIVGV